jgi:hypothetical protein
MASNYNQTFTNVGLNTLSFSIPTTAAGLPCVCFGSLSLPQGYDDGGLGTSAVVVTVAQNASTIYTGLAGAEGFRVNFLAAGGDAMTVAFSSAAAIDQPLNAVKAVVGCCTAQ